MTNSEGEQLVMTPILGRQLTIMNSLPNTPSGMYYAYRNGSSFVRILCYAEHILRISPFSRHVVFPDTLNSWWRLHAFILGSWRGFRNSGGRSSIWRGLGQLRLSFSHYLTIKWFPSPNNKNSVVCMNLSI